MTTDLFIVILQDKSTAFVRTESGRIFDITGCEPITDSKYGINLNGVLATARQVNPEYVADLLTKGASIFFKKKPRRRATSKSKSKRIARERGVYIQ